MDRGCKRILVLCNTGRLLAIGKYSFGRAFGYFDEEGRQYKNRFFDLGEKTYYATPNAPLAIGFCEVKGKLYYFGTDGSMYKYCGFSVDGIDYYADKAGAVSRLYAIEGKTGTTVEQMVRYYKQNSPITYPAEKLKVGGGATIEEFAKIYYEEASAEGIKAEIAWTQSMKETGWLKFGGSVKIEQFNFAGLGSTSSGVTGADFSKYGKDGVRMGVRAQIQHLKAYASTTIKKGNLKYPCVDERFDLVSPKGCARYVEWLGIQENPLNKGWAASEKYGYDIVEMIKKLKTT